MLSPSGCVCRAEDYHQPDGKPMKTKRVSKAITLLLTLAVLLTMGNVSRASAAPGDADFGYYAPSDAQSMTVTYYDPATPDQRTEIPVGYSSHMIPAGSLMDFEIVMQPTWQISSTGSLKVSIDQFDITRTDEGKNAVLTYTLKGFDPKGQWIRISGWQTQMMNYAHFDLKGGTWNDSKETELAGDGTYYQLFITPYETVYKPKDPTRDGYKFMGWVGTSQLEPEHNAEADKKVFTRDNPYQFDEKDPNIAVNYIRGRIVTLSAAWERIMPTLEVEDKEIKVGDDFDPKDLLKSAKDYAGTNLSGDVVVSGSYRVDKPGTYPLTYTVTDKNGGKTTKTANLVVKQTPAVIVTPPKLDTNTVEITAGDDLDLTSLYNAEEGTQVFVDPNSKFNTAKAGNYEINLVAIDKDGVKTTKTVNLTVKAAEKPAEEPVRCVCSEESKSDKKLPKTGVGGAPVDSGLAAAALAGSGAVVARSRRKTNN